jgi:phosphoglycolate phosphatase-like HAD superfamily hydrolase
MGCLAQELLVVGDFRFDVIAGKRAGAMTILLTNGGESTMRSEDPEPDFVCEDLGAVTEIVLKRVTLP